ELSLKPRPRKALIRGFADFCYDRARLAALGHRWFECQNDECELTILRQQLAADDLICHYASDKLIIGCAIWHLFRKERSGSSALLWRLAGRENRNKPAYAIDQLQICGEIA